MKEEVQGNTIVQKRRNSPHTERVDEEGDLETEPFAPIRRVTLGWSSLKDAAKTRGRPWGQKASRTRQHLWQWAVPMVSLPRRRRQQVRLPLPSAAPTDHW